MRFALRQSGRNHARRDPQALRISPGDLPEFLLRTPYRAEAWGGWAHFGSPVGDARRDDVVVAASQGPGFRLPRRRGDDQLDGLVLAGRLGVIQVPHADKTLTVALDQLPGSLLSRTQRCTRLHRPYNERGAKRVDDGSPRSRGRRRSGAFEDRGDALAAADAHGDER